MSQIFLSAVHEPVEQDPRLWSDFDQLESEIDTNNCFSKQNSTFEQKRLSRDCNVCSKMRFCENFKKYQPRTTVKLEKIKLLSKLTQEIIVKSSQITNVLGDTSSVMGQAIYCLGAWDMT